MQEPWWLRRAVHFPSFFLAVLVLYWGTVLAALTGRINLLRRKGRNDQFYTTKFLLGALRVKVLRAGEGQLHRGKCMYLANHRSWADFFIDACLTEGRAVPLSRGMVAVGFPALVMPLLAVRAILVFNKRKVSKDVQAFNSWLDRKMADSPHDSILVYPEGHRGIAGQSQPLKRGMLHYAYSRTLPIQVVMSANKEAVISEKEDVARWGQTVVVSYSELVEPSKFQDFEDFAREVQRHWGAEWVRAHSAQLDGLPELQFAPQLLEYTRSQQVKSATVITVWATAFLSSLFCTYIVAAWMARALASLHPLLAPMLVMLVVVFCSVSAREAWQAVDLRGGPASGAGCKALQGVGVKDSVTEEAGRAARDLAAGKEE